MSQLEIKSEDRQQQPKVPSSSNSKEGRGKQPKPSSGRKIASSRANGAQPRGPTTPEGEQISAANGILKHGMLAQTMVLPCESKELVDQLLAAHQPLTLTELDLVENMAVARWRQMRTWSIQRNGLTREIVKHERYASTPRAAAAIGFRALSDQSNSFNNAHRYETSYDRQYKSALRELTNLRTHSHSSVECFTVRSRRQLFQMGRRRPERRNCKPTWQISVRTQSHFRTPHSARGRPVTNMIGRCAKGQPRNRFMTLHWRSVASSTAWVTK